MMAQLGPAVCEREASTENIEGNPEAWNGMKREDVMLNQTELEQLARHMRAIGMHYSWSELLEFSECVVGSLVEAYQTLLRNSVSSETAPSAGEDDLRISLEEKLGKALISLTSQGQVARWESEAWAGTNPVDGR
jgi:hypothetical protein